MPVERSTPVNVTFRRHAGTRANIPTEELRASIADRPVCDWRRFSDCNILRGRFV